MKYRRCSSRQHHIAILTALQELGQPSNVYELAIYLSDYVEKVGYDVFSLAFVNLCVAKTRLIDRADNTRACSISPLNNGARNRRLTMATINERGERWLVEARKNPTGEKALRIKENPRVVDLKEVLSVTIHTMWRPTGAR